MRKKIFGVLTFFFLFESTLAKEKVLSIEDLAPEKVEDNSLKSQDIEKIIPLNMAPTRDGGDIAEGIMQKSAENYVEGRTRDYMQKRLIKKFPKYDRKLASIENNLGSDLQMGKARDGRNHNLRIQLMDRQGIVSARYRGYLTLQYNYYVGDSDMNFKLQEEVYDLGLELEHRPFTSQTYVNMGWDW